MKEITAYKQAMGMDLLSSSENQTTEVVDVV